MKKILVTGATGFVGRQCLPILTESGSYEVHALSSWKSEPDDKSVRWHCADLRDHEKVAQILSKIKSSHLLHMAWYVIPGKYWTSLENFKMVQASLSLYENFVRFGGERLVSAGTCAEYDWNYGYCSEGVTPCNPNTVYGICKHSTSSLLRSFCKTTGLSGAWGRIFFLYGDHEDPKRLVASVIFSLLKGKPALCSHGRQIRDFLYVKDVAGASIALLESTVEGPVNICSGVPLALKEIIMKIADKLGREDLIQLGALSASPNEPKLLVGDNTILKDIVGWKPGYDLDQGVEATIEWWKCRK